jgi:hypothetical protein
VILSVSPDFLINSPLKFPYSTVIRVHLDSDIYQGVDSLCSHNLISRTLLSLSRARVWLNVHMPTPEATPGEPIDTAASLPDLPGSWLIQTAYCSTDHQKVTENPATSGIHCRFKGKGLPKRNECAEVPRKGVGWFPRISIYHSGTALYALANLHVE